ncbi:virulence factor TspB C-terminal domain-related protein [Roseateles aquae]|uniref:virulence factor TspB C-terminal domain-related protein n=1 Tax=Roseateles aquae TaxID=3077235 RepID=UPI0028EED834|nr:virulence factor TspB C-terminal domain-related protein [Paucibacter sp. APW11]
MTCDGDAIQCAIAAEQQKRNCQWYDEYNKPAKEKGDQLQALNGQAMPDGHPGKQPPEMDASRLVRDVDLLAGSCPADIPLNLSGQTVVIPLGSMCGPLQMMGQLGVGLAYFLAAFIMFGKRG